MTRLAVYTAMRFWPHVVADKRRVRTYAWVAKEFLVWFARNARRGWAQYRGVKRAVPAGVQCYFLVVGINKRRLFRI